MEKGIKDFTRKLRLVEFFLENPELDTPDSSLVKNKSNFFPPQNQNSTLEFGIYKNKASTRKILKTSPIFQTTNGKIF